MTERNQRWEEAKAVATQVALRRLEWALLAAGLVFVGIGVFARGESFLVAVFGIALVFAALWCNRKRARLNMTPRSVTPVEFSPDYERAMQEAEAAAVRGDANAAIAAAQRAEDIALADLRNKRS